MARPRTPTAELERTGAFVKDPQRAREDAPTRAPLGDPPATLPAEMYETWQELRQIAPVDVLRCADAWVVENAVRLMYSQRTEEKFTMAQMSQLNWCLSRMGMTPSDRSKVNATAAKPDADPADKYFN